MILQVKACGKTVGEIFSPTFYVEFAGTAPAHNPQATPKCTLLCLPLLRKFSILAGPQGLAAWLSVLKGRFR